MEKFVIKNADGSEQNVIPAVHDSHKSAREAILNYMKDNIALMGDKIHFNFIIECEILDTNEYITDFEKAQSLLDPRDFYRIEHLGSRTNDLINLNHLHALLALNKLFTIAEAWNKVDNFVPDLTDSTQLKWFPCFNYYADESKFLCYGVSCSYVNVGNICSSHICFKTEERAMQFGKQFVDLFNEVLLGDN